MSDELPKYEAPPVVETVLGISFVPLGSFQVPHFGMFWERIRENYQQFQVQPPLPDEYGLTAQPQFIIDVGFGSPRCWFINDSEGWLIQVQNSRFVSNWRKRPDGEYPSYSRFKERFTQDWFRFTEFLEGEKLGGPQLILAEVSYINHIEIDSDTGRVFEPFNIFDKAWKGSFLPGPTSFGMNLNYPIEKESGRLQIVCQPVVRHVDLREVIQLTVTAKTTTLSNDADGLLSALDLGHEWVVRGFTDFTSKSMHEQWKRYK